ncbi:MAG: hypothetical protein A3G25_00335 [Betaproteobacteria bacterium RIFCSPLOWO2_12_FULL_63_13]|nr:MAG: hypothetical protein A3G25_00335 [Betaproteobacteria bacterium RIFCSPLOWO2_12_FULL_63_13]
MCSELPAFRRFPVGAAFASVPHAAITGTRTPGGRAARPAQRVQKGRARQRGRCTRQFGIVAFTMPAR